MLRQTSGMFVAAMIVLAATTVAATAAGLF